PSRKKKGDAGYDPASASRKTTSNEHNEETICKFCKMISVWSKSFEKSNQTSHLCSRVKTIGWVAKKNIKKDGSEYRQR
ncbi:MAG: hypothetical protein L0287_38120, partial [Anaerolineae bacterium]|nr:hypothetical protein [Anaerolineae bacterium]